MTTIQVVCETHGVQNLTPGPATVNGLPLRCPLCEQFGQVIVSVPDPVPGRLYWSKVADEGQVPVDPSEPEKPQLGTCPRWPDYPHIQAICENQSKWQPLPPSLHWADNRLEAQDNEWKRQQAQRVAEDKDAVLQEIVTVWHDWLNSDDRTNWRWIEFVCNLRPLVSRAERLMKGDK